jgi:hypothetical protein
MCFTILLMLYHSLFLSLLPEFHRAVLLLQTCSTSEFVCDQVCFCVRVYLLDLSSTHERKHVAFVFLSFFFSASQFSFILFGLCVSEPGLLHLTLCPPTVSIYLQTKCCLYSWWLSKTPLCIYATFYWSIHQL